MLGFVVHQCTSALFLVVLIGWFSFLNVCMVVDGVKKQIERVYNKDA